MPLTGTTVRLNSDGTKDYGKAGTDNIKLIDISTKSDKLSFRAIGSAGNPLVDGAPAIDYDMKFEVDKNGLVCTSGRHDGFPNYEIYKQVDGNYPVPLLTYDHGSKDAFSLFPPMDESFSQRCF